MIKIGIVIIHWHNSTEVSSLLEQILEWQEVIFDIIVVDNSNDYTLKVAGEGVHLSSKHDNLGFAGGCNYGIQWAMERNCEQILLLNADISIQESSVLALQNQLSQNQNLAAVAPVLKEIKNGVVSFHKGGQHPLKYNNTRRVIEPNENTLEPIAYLPGTVLLIRRRALTDIGLLDESYFFSGEIADWFLRLASTEWTFALHSGVSVDHLNSGNETYRKKHYIYYSLRNRYLLIEKFAEADKAKLFKRWTKQLRRQMIGALVRLNFEKFITIYRAAKDGSNRRFGMSDDF